MAAKKTDAARKLPHNLDAEQAVLGSILFSNEAFDPCADILTDADFFDPVHAALWRAIAKKIAAGETADPITLRNEAQGLEELGGANYLKQILIAAGQPQSAVSYAKAIRAERWRRDLLRLAESLGREAETTTDPDAVLRAIQTAQDNLDDLLRGERAAPISLGVAATQAVDQAAEACRLGGHIIGRSTGMPRLDRELGGIAEGRFIVLGARPKVGKTSLALQWGIEIARKSAATDGGLVLMFSMEMRGKALAFRALAGASGLRAKDLMQGSFSAAEYDRAADAARMFERLPFLIDETARQDFGAIMSSIRAHARRGKVALVIIDYLQKIRIERERGESRTDQIGRVTGSLQGDICLGLNIPVLALSQLNRATERDSRPPQLSDLRSSGDIEQDADQVILLHRDENYPGPTDAIIAANRWGATGKIELYFDGPTTSFRELPAEDLR